jgi:purine-binding chemotaxis protein CheW
MPEKEEKPVEEIIQIINFRLGNNEFGVDISTVKEIIRAENITHIPEAPSFIHGLANLRGQIIPVLDLARQFGLTGEEQATVNARIIVTELDHQLVGMLVDEVPGVLKIAEENIENTPELIQNEIKRDYIKGVGKLDNRLIILLDLKKTLAPHEVKELSKVVTKES